LNVDVYFAVVLLLLDLVTLYVLPSEVNVDF
jgi:hypothetical protein